MAQTVQRRMFSEHEKSRYLINADANEIGYSSSFMGEFDCPDCPHTFTTRIDNVSIRNRWCPYCNSYKLCDKDCDFCEKKSFASHVRAACWSTKNLQSPRQVVLFTQKKMWFVCDKCPHEFEAAVSRVSGGGWCGYCRHLKLCDDEECDFCKANSFASHPKSVFWSKLNSLTARQVLRCSQKLYKFECQECPHTFETSPKSISIQDSWCLYCAHHQICGEQECIYCYERSFACHPRVKFWSSKNPVNPLMVALFSNVQYIFDCPGCKNEYSQSPANIASNNCGCPHCRFKTRRLLYDALCSVYSYVKAEAKFDWCRNPNTDYKFPYDFDLMHVKLLELDGEHHFRQVSNWSPPEENHLRDLAKMEAALDNGFKIIRIYQPDVLKDIKWAIQMIQDALASPALVVYISKSDVYKDWDDFSWHSAVSP